MNRIKLCQEQKDITKAAFEEMIKTLQRGYVIFLCNALHNQLCYKEDGRGLTYDIRTWFEGERPGPSKHREFYMHPLFIKDLDSRPWWNTASWVESQDKQELLEQKILFLQHLINTKL
jgi:hypothetical protein